jgi:hypothetical protein
MHNVNMYFVTYVLCLVKKCAPLLGLEATVA